MASVVRSTALRAGGACVRCRKGKTKCVYEGGRAPCKNCAKGMHDCYLPTDSMSHGAHGVSPARVQQRARESLASERAVSSTSGDRQAPPPSSAARHVSTTTEKYVYFYFLFFSLMFPFAFGQNRCFFTILRGCAGFSGCARILLVHISLFSFLSRALRWQRLFSRPLPVASTTPSPGSPNFLRPAFISQTGTRNFSPAPCAPSRLTPRSVLALARNERSSSPSGAPCQSCRIRSAAFLLLSL